MLLLLLSFLFILRLLFESLLVMFMSLFAPVLVAAAAEAAEAAAAAAATV